MSLRQRLYLGLALLSACVVLVIFIALSLPQTSWEFSVSQEQRLQASSANKQPVNVLYFMAGEQKLEASFHLGIEEPDTVETYFDFNKLMTNQDWLMKNKAQITMHLEDGTVHRLAFTSRQLTDLSGMFWLNLFCGSLGFLICLLIKSTGSQQPGINDFVITGISYLLSVFAASIYSTKNLLIDGHLYHSLSMLNHAGAMLFSASLTAFLWNYPKQIGGFPFRLFSYLVFALNMLVDGFQLTDGSATGSYLWVFSLFLVALLGSAMQWWAARKNPLDRGAVRWLLISIYAGTIFYAGGMMLPIILGFPTLASQGLLFTTFLLMYGGLALGVIRYRLFDLERWWFSIWAWFLGGLAILFVDGLIVITLTVSNTSALAIATAVVGWLYFPIRQWCWHFLSYRKKQSIELWLPQIVSSLANVKTPLQLENTWSKSLQDFYQTLSIEVLEIKITDSHIEQNGLQLVVPRLTRKGCIVLSHASQGQRLFTRSDLKNFELLWTMFDIMHKAILAKAEGANNERDRIRKDIHDDLGAKLLSIQLSAKEKEPANLAKEALSDLKNLLQSIEIEPISLIDAIELWQLETQNRQFGSVKIVWNIALDHRELELPPEYFSNLTRALRECVTNAIKHAEPKKIQISLTLKDDLIILIQNDGAHKKPLDTITKSINDGRGSGILAERCARLGGTFKTWQAQENWYVQITIPLSDLHSS